MIRISTMAVAAALVLTACSPASDAADGGAEPSTRTLAQELKAAGDLGTLQGVLDNSGLTKVLEGVGPYTLFAPVDGAFAKAADFDFRDDAEKAQAAALLRSHMVPGAVTMADVDAAIGRASDGQVKMRTLDGGLISFAKNGENVVATMQDGGRAVLTGDQVLASNGVIQPIDAVLLQAPAT